MSSFKTILIAMFVLALLLLVGANLGHAQTEIINEVGTTTEKAQVLVPQVTDIIIPEKEGENIALRQADKEIYQLDETHYKMKVYSEPIYAMDFDGFYTRAIQYLPKASSSIIQDLISLFVPTANALTTTTPAIIDTFIDTPDGKNGSGTTLDTYGGQDTAILINVTLPADIPDTTISDVVLYLYKANKWDTGTHVYNIYELLRQDWTETDADYTHYMGTTAWTTSGADSTVSDYDSTIIDTRTNSTSASSWDQWTLMGADADNPLSLDWGNTAYLKIECDVEGDTECNSRYNSTEHATTNLRPYIEITYEINEATTTATSTTCDMTAGTLDDDVISEYLLYFFYVILLFVILTMGYWIVDRFFHSLSGRKYD